MNNNITTEQKQQAPAPTTIPVTLTELITSLEQATAMAKQLPSTTNRTHLLQIYTSLHQSHHLLSSFLSHPHFPNPPPPHATAENSLSSATGAAEDEPMQIGDDDDHHHQDGNCEQDSSNAMIENVEERMRDCFIKSKRAKRPLSPAAVAAVEVRRLFGGDGDGGVVMGFDPYGSRLKALELIYQFHG